MLGQCYQHASFEIEYLANAQFYILYGRADFMRGNAIQLSESARAAVR
jgi:hypothetical protein